MVHYARIAPSIRHISKLISLILITLLIIPLIPTPVHAGWYSTNWLSRKSITIDNTKVSGTANLSNFPVLISLASDSDLALDARSDGYDILFTSADGTTKLDHEIEYYNSSTGQLVAWVEVPTLSYNTDTVIYMYYDYPSASDQSNSTGVWGTNYDAVWHLDENASSTGTTDVYTDSTSNVNHGDDQISATDQSGQIANGQDFDGTDDYIPVTDDDSLSPGDGSGDNAFSVSAWVYMDDATNFDFINKLPASSGGGGYEWIWHTNSSDQQELIMYDDTVGNYISRNTSGSYTADEGSWVFLAVTYTGNESNSGITLYRNGSSQSDNGGSNGTYVAMHNTTSAVDIGAFRISGSEAYSNGHIDELRIATSALSADWLTTEFNNQNSPSTFYTLGSEVGDSETDQIAYRFFANADSTDVGAALAATNTGITLSSPGTDFRLRMAFHYTQADLDQSDRTYKLQYAVRSGTCDTLFSGESYADITTTTPIAFNDNATPTDGAALTDNANDPDHAAHTINNQTYEEANNFSNSQSAIPAGQDGLWDFALTDYAGTADTTYCIRAVHSTGVVLDTYTVIPELTIPPGLTFTIAGTSTSSTYNGITTTGTTTATTLPFGKLSPAQVKYLAHELYVSSNAASGYDVYMNQLATATLQGLDPSNVIDPFSAAGASWSTPIVWSSPTGTVKNVNTGWIGANTDDTRVTGWSSASAKFGPVSTTANPVMTSTTADTGTTAHVTYAFEVNALQPTDLYSGQIIYTITPHY